MNSLAQLLLTPDNIERLNRIEEGYKIYDCASYILKQLGESSGETRLFQGRLYRINKQNQTLTISRLHDDSIIYAALDNQDKGVLLKLKNLV
ncbi:MAG: hypothetical protein HC764_25910 [Pleurocapsa sp. CRU_1_2]|nr:hypothetical protein [Pleurocapsa sp. CRU_1_2]